MLYEMLTSVIGLALAGLASTNTCLQCRWLCLSSDMVVSVYQGKCNMATNNVDRRALSNDFIQ